MTVRASPNVLWPPDGRYVEITMRIAADDPPPRLRLAAITCNQKCDLGADVRDAAFGTDDRTFLLKATISATTRDRIYRIVYEAIDAAGNASRATARVVVPRHPPATPGASRSSMGRALYERTRSDPARGRAATVTDGSTAARGR